MSPLTFLIAITLLLIVPGPTNTVLAMAGSSGGFFRSLPHALVVLAGYLTTVLPIALFAAPVLNANPAFGVIVKLAAAAWVLILAAQLWSRDLSTSRGGAIDARTVYATTLLNPKGLVTGLALLPAAVTQAGLAIPLAALVGVVLGVSGLWLGFGATVIAPVSRRHPVLVARMASGSLVLFSAGLAAKAAGLV